ncbi:MAG: serine dehydratase subunit alpha family protein, partial [Clostridiales bacterium]|nr:serine dehydratase subunit alpha family protein [Clostridiales bacterium]
MKQNDILYQTYLNILKEHLVPAMGCTEPIAIAYGAAKARELLGELPDRVIAQVSSNIIKNVKSVVVPNTDGLKGVEAAVAAGIVAGVSKEILEVISKVSENEKIEIKKYKDRDCIQVEAMESEFPFDLILTLFAKNSYIRLRIANYHTNIVFIEKDNKIIFQPDYTNEKGT